MRFVEKIARDLQLNCEIGSTDVGALARRSKLSIETAARFARFAFFVEAARRRRCSSIFLAHHADDLVETALLNLFRGASPGGMAALRKISVHRIGKTKLTILRPLLGVWRSEINSYIGEQASGILRGCNERALHSSRNRIRHRILTGYRKTIRAGSAQNDLARGANLGEEEAVLDYSSPVDFGNPCLNAGIAETASSSATAYNSWWFERRSCRDAGSIWWRDVRSLIEPGTTSKINLPRDQHFHGLFTHRRRAKRFLLKAKWLVASDEFKMNKLVLAGDRPHQIVFALNRDISVDVLVIGGGITGISAAYLLKQSGLTVALIERTGLATTDTGHTTAHLTYITDTRLHTLAKNLGADHAGAAWDAGAAALDEIEAIVRGEGIDCEFTRLPAYLHVPLDNAKSGEMAKLKEDADLAQKMGFDAGYLNSIPHFGVPGIRFANQAKFHPRKYLGGLIEAIPGNGTHVFENTAAGEFDAEKRRVKANGHWISFDRVVIATNNPLVGFASHDSSDVVSDQASALQQLCFRGAHS